MPLSDWFVSSEVEISNLMVKDAKEVKVLKGKGRDYCRNRFGSVHKREAGVAQQRS